MCSVKRVLGWNDLPGRMWFVLFLLAAFGPLSSPAFPCRLIGTSIGRKHEYALKDELKGPIAFVCLDDLYGDCGF
jgi:hypothetical protein